MPASFPVISDEFWVGVGAVVLVSILVFFPFQAFTNIYVPFTVTIYDRHVTLRYFLSIFWYAKIFPFISVAIRSSVINDSFCLCSRRCAVVSYIDRLFYRVNFHAWKIQERVIHWYKAWKLLVKSGHEQPMSRLWYYIIYSRWWPVVVQLLL